ncbi:MAG: GIY-YIG nuclease family protein [Chloroflexota bacterium]
MDAQLAAADIPPVPGTYALLLRCFEAQPAPVRRLGVQPLAPGWYVYVGSAFGPGGLRGRLKHHLAPAARRHWHIDALKAAAPLQAAWITCDARRLEHAWTHACLRLPGVTVPWPRFGASDCRCPAHLFRWPARPRLADFAAALALDIPVDADCPAHEYAV